MAVPTTAVSTALAPSSGLSAGAPDAVLLAAYSADATLLPRLHLETHRAFLAAALRHSAGDEALEAAWADYRHQASAALRLPDLEPPNSPREQAAMVSAMRITLRARQFFLDYTGPEMSPADRLAAVRPSTAVLAHRLGTVGGEHPEETSRRRQFEAELGAHAA